MASPTVSFADFLIKRRVEGWGRDKGFDATDQIRVHFYERFQVAKIEVVETIDNGDFLTLQATTDQWTEPREFALLSNGSLAW